MPTEEKPYLQHLPGLRKRLPQPLPSSNSMRPSNPQRRSREVHPRNKDISVPGGHLLSLGAPSHLDRDGHGASRPVKRVGGLRQKTRPTSRTLPGTRNGRPPPHPKPDIPLTPCSPGEYSHVLGGQSPALHHTDIQGAALGHGYQPQTFRAGGRPGPEAGLGVRRPSTCHQLRAWRPSRVPTPPVRNTGSWAGGFRRRTGVRDSLTTAPGLYR